MPPFVLSRGNRTAAFSSRFFYSYMELPGNLACVLALLSCEQPAAFMYRRRYWEAPTASVRVLTKRKGAVLTLTATAHQIELTFARFTVNMPSP